MSQRYARIVYSEHAQDQMRVRKVSRRQVERTLNDPDGVFPAHSGRFIAERRTAVGNILRVVFVEREDRLDIVTAIVITVIRTTRTGEQ